MVYESRKNTSPSKLLALDPYKKNAYSQNVTFDIRHLDKSPAIRNAVVKASDESYDPEVSAKKTPAKDWELDVKSLISSKKWLQNYGLKKNRLTFFQILPVIGFKHSDDFDKTLKRPVSSRYGTGLFSTLFHPGEGKTFNITCGREMLKQIEGRLTQAIHLFNRRLEWLTTESRRLFGVIEEKAITIVLDIRNMSPQQFDQYRIALETVIYEQLTQISKFNLIRSADDMQMYHPECVPVTHDTIQGAVDWLWELDRLASVSKTATAEAVLKAMTDQHNEAVYLFTEGNSIDSCKELLKEKVQACSRKIPLHLVSYNCDSSDIVRFLREFARGIGSKFHAYAVVMEMDAYEGQPLDPKTNKANIVLKKKTFGGVPPGAGMREDVMLIFEELEEARNVRSQIQALTEQVPEPKIQIESKITKWDKEVLEEQYMGTKEWLGKYGLNARKLELFDVLGSVAFKHQDGAVDINVKPPENTQTDAVKHTKLVNARYCDRFPIVKWRDGRVVHVQVTPELHRDYERKMTVAVNSFHQRIDWLNKGSRALFGTVIEDQIYILIDTSASMLPSIQYLKDKLFLLMQEQIRHKKKFNLISFNSKATAWQNRLTDISELSLKGAWKWIQGLSCWGSTNTYAALQHALSDPGTQAIYLLTDGRPDQPPKSIIAQVQMHHTVPVHAISFNCNDKEANEFLFDLAKATGGRYHYFSEKGKDFDQPESWESEDIRLIKDEIQRGLESLDKVEELRDECSNLSYKKELAEMKRCSRDHVISNTDRTSAVPPLDTKDLYRSTPSPPPRPKSAPPVQSPRFTPTPPKSARPSVSSDFRPTPSSGRPQSARPRSSRPRSSKSLSASSKAGLSASHTKTSMLRTLNSSGRFSPNEWLLPETRSLFEKQAERQKELALVLQRFNMSPYVVDPDEAEEDANKKKRKKKVIRSKEMSSKMWLSKNGLVARKLTILDALSPTMVSHKTKYVPILDKHVVAKVFDEILPVAHVSSRTKNQITLVNPTAVDLKGYKKKVQKCIDQYKARLNKIVWNSLPESAKSDFDSVEPVSFEDNRVKLMKALDNAGWPIREQDILLLEKEIARGEKYKEQAEDLRRASDPNRQESFDDLLKNRSRGSSVSSSSRSSRRSSVSSRSSGSSGRSRSSGSMRSRASPISPSSPRSRTLSRSPSPGRRNKEDDELNVYEDKASVASSLNAYSHRDDEVSPK